MKKDTTKTTRPQTAKRFRKATGIHICTGHLGKMESMWSLSTSCLHNGRCLARMKSGNCVCAHCYAKAQMESGRCDAMRELLAVNSMALSARLIGMEEWPLLNVRLFRFEAFGDVINAVHARNYIRLAKRNPGTTFAAWTKNLNLWETAILAEGRPRNLVLVYSSPTVNRRARVPDRYREIVDHVFTVWSDEAAAADSGVKITCGARHCLSCGRCYTTKTALHVDELLRR